MSAFKTLHLLKKTTSILFITSVVFITSSCGQENFNINTEKASIKIDVSQVIEKAGLIKLKKVLSLKNPNDIIASVDKILVCDNRLFAFDKTQGLLHSFNLEDGSYINTINKLGVGPNETVGLADFAIDSLEKEIILYDRQEGKLLFTDYNGKFHRLHRILPYSRQFSILNGKELLFYFDNNFPDENTNFALTDYTGKIKTKFLSMFNGTCISTDFCGITSPSINPGEIYISNSFGNTIFLLDKNKNVNPIYHFDCGSESLPDDPKEICSAFDKGLDKFSICFLTKKFFELKNKKTYISYVKGNKVLFLIIEPSGNIVKSYKPKEEFYKRIFSESIGSYQNNIISVISPFNVKRVLAGDLENLFVLKSEIGSAEKDLRTFDERNGNILVGIFEVK